MKRSLFILMFSLVLYKSLPLLACTGVVVSNDELTLVANNEDYINPLTKIWFIPAQSGKHGCIFFGFDDYYPQGGMNNQGLFFDGFSTEPLKVTGSIHRERYNGYLVEKVMHECTTVKEVIAIFNKYNLDFLERAMLFFADKSGDSVIIEGDEFVRKKGHYQIVTNFYQSKLKPADYSCERYKTAKKILEESDEISVDLCLRILDATHQDFIQFGTLYSNIYDLKKCIINLYYFHDFTKKITIDLKKELAKGKHFYDLPSLFPKNKAAESFKKSALSGLNKRIEKRRWTKANPKEFKIFTGSYQMEQNPFSLEKIYIYEDNNRLFIDNLKRPEAKELIPYSEESFYYYFFSYDYKVTFHKNEHGIVTGALIEDGRNLHLNMKKLPPLEGPI